MSALAAEQGALNLSQGFPDFDGPTELLERVNHHLRNGGNQYAPMIGVASLREAVANKVARLYGRDVCPDTEVTITSGATEALFCSLTALVQPKDEVLLLDPAYDSYAPVIRLAGGVPVHVPMVIDSGCYRVDWDQVAAAVTGATRAIVTNSPNNPTGMVFDSEDINALARLADKYGLAIVADEVYEHMAFDGRSHISMTARDDLYGRSFTVSSFGKTYHTTGWKIGYCVAPAHLTALLRKIHQYVTFTSHTPSQLGLADFLTAQPEYDEQLSAFYQAKRDRFLATIAGSKFNWVPTQGTYFQLLDYTAFGLHNDWELARKWTYEAGFASIPLSPFYADPQPSELTRLRFCFAKDDETLDRAGRLLCQL
ncbi:MAG: methionine aminotransferase [Pseudomonadaceae bacterium]|nr:methionine aminotransferase [Pseudomonadaceae bacterium]